MKIILTKDVPNLGEEGDIREVARGYARNFLIPRGFGVLHTKQNLAILSSHKAAIEKRKDEKRQAALGVKQRIEELSIAIEMTAGDSGKLFGAVTSATIAEELSKLGVQVERKRIEIAEHSIKSTGNHTVKVKLYGNEVAQLKVQVTRSAPKSAGGSEGAPASAPAPQTGAAAHEKPESAAGVAPSSEGASAEQ